MQQPQRPQYLATAHRVTAMRPVALYALLLLSLLASLWQIGQHAPRSGIVESTASASAEERSGGEKQLEEESPAKLRRVAGLRVPRAAQQYPELQGHTFAVAAVLRHSLIPAAPGQPRHTLPSLRQQRGQAPPLA
ncbi:MAG: hypothetical protein ACREP4_14750 [Stenotrophomonas sp.]|uniref:hypothetical protein n=1 Tax=Stenotrophomonas sp. TaxID=69392 RepID=UPI003D6D6024